MQDLFDKNFILFFALQIDLTHFGEKGFSCPQKHMTSKAQDKKNWHLTGQTIVLKGANFMQESL